MVEETKKEENVEEQKITKKDIEQLSNTLSVAFKSIDDRIKHLEQQKQPSLEMPSEQIQQQPQQKADLNNPMLQLLLSQAFKSEDSSFGTAENRQFFAEVGKADFDAFRLMQQRRLMKLLEQANKSGVV